ncbi:MAG: hypothetical protein JSV28_00200 [Deltaproteobacteria bacterium]|nr:MAG: hypothetical protein JSV28_00200 [Deltaproteobacteria bacterium]
MIGFAFGASAHRDRAPDPRKARRDVSGPASLYNEGASKNAGRRGDGRQAEGGDQADVARGLPVPAVLAGEDPPCPVN